MWIYKNNIVTEIPTDAKAFVYIIKRTNLMDDISSPYLYIGKKNFYKNDKSESDWKTYYGSSNYLAADIEKYGLENFEREILHICYSKSEATWLEVVEQIERRVLRVDKSSICKKIYYNSNILGKFYKDSIFTNEDIQRYKSYMSEIDTTIERKYVTNGIYTKALDINLVDLTEFLNNNNGWYIGSSLNNTHNKGKIRVENIDGQPIFVDKTLSHTYPKYAYSVCTDGTTDVYIKNSEVDDFLEQNDNWYMGSKNNGMYKKINNGIIERKIHIGLIDDFLEQNDDWHMGGIKSVEKIKYISLINFNTFSQGSFPESEIDTMLQNGWELANSRFISSYYKWINNGVVEKKISPNDIDDHIKEGYNLGRLSTSNKNKICITNGDNIKYIDIKQLDDYINSGYVRGNNTITTLKDRNKVFVCEDETYTQYLIDTDKVDDFIKSNPTFRIGQFKRDNFNTSNKVFAIDIRTNEKINVTTEEYKNNEFLTSIKTRRVKIYDNIKNKLIFKGYLKLFCIEQGNAVPPLKTLTRFIDKERVFFEKGVNVKYNSLNIRIEAMKR